MRHLISYAVLPSRTDFGAFIRSHREELGLSQSKFAIRVGVDRTYVSRLESGVRSRTTFATAQKIAAVLGVNVQELMRLMEPKRRQGIGALGQLVRNRRQELHMSTADLGKEVGASKQFISQIELGEVTLANKSAKWIPRLALALKLEEETLEIVRSKSRQAA